MTGSELLAWIGSAILVQIVAGVGMALRRRRLDPLAAPTSPTRPAHGTSGAWAGSRKFRVRRRAMEDPARTQCSFWLAPVDGTPLPPFRPGQFLTFALQVPAAAPAEGTRLVTRCYSLSDGPDPGAYRVTIKRVLAPPGREGLPAGVSSSYFHDHVHEGDLLDVKAPSGHFFIDPDPAVPVVLIAGGIGITPMMSMLRWCEREQPQRTVHLYYGLRNAHEHAFKADLEAMAQGKPNLHLHVAYSRPAPSDRQGVDFQHQGRVDADLLRSTLPHGRHQFYICGPSAMMESVVSGLALWGVPDADVHYEAFGPASIRKGGGPASDGSGQAAAAFEIRFQRSGRTLTWQGEQANLLDFAEKHGVQVDSGCRSGSCGSCETRVVSGSVDYDSPPDFDVTAGHCLLCTGRPSGTLVLEA
jgi:ferredoxin-NADP reductase